MRLPPPALIVLRLIATLLLSLVIAQAGWASAFLGGQEQYERLHAIGGPVTLAASVIGAGIYLVLRSAAGTVNVVLAVLLAAMLTGQYLIGGGALVSLHIFTGVLIAMVATALTSWTYRHQPASSVTAAKG